MYLHRFTSVPPRFSVSQAESLRWLAWIHGRTGTAANFEKLFFRFGCDPEKIAERSYEHPAYGRYEDDSAKALLEFPISKRMKFFDEVASERLAACFKSGSSAPGLLVHVTCTGYVSPSAAQKWVANNGWSTAVLHAYHMGCYAALPAIRAAGDFVQVNDRRADIVHNELCTLHLDPRLHTPEQFVVQSLFADGHIGYSVSKSTNDRALEVVAIQEELVPDSQSAMTWSTSENGFQMTLSRDIPDLLHAAVGGFLGRLREKGGDFTDALYAIHPGGPRILDLMTDLLQLRPEQIKDSRAVLLKHGNMSSATLPHVWLRMLADSEFQSGRPVVSLAFGPGLTIFGSLMRCQ